MRLSLRFRLLIPALLLLAGTVAATFWAARHSAETVDRQIQDRIRSIEQTVHGPPTFRLNEPVLKQMRGLTGAELVVFGSHGERIATIEDSDVSAGDYRKSEIPIRPPHPNEGSTLLVLYPEALRQAAIRDAVRPALWLGTVGGLVAFALAAITARRIVRRIRDIEARTRDIADGTFEPIPLPAANDEIRDLILSVNRMTLTLAAYREKLQVTERLRILGQFSGGLAHELRNAASGARLALQLYLRDSNYHDTEAIEVALRQLKRIETNLSQFLNLGRPDVGRREPFEAARIFTQALESLCPQAEHTGTKLVWDAMPTGSIVGNAEQWGHVVSNLVGNAIEAAGPGGHVEFQALRNEERWLITVSDSGPGPKMEIAEKLFEPFVTGKEQGVGLGLAVVRQIVESHGGQIRWDRQNQRTVFTIELPVKSSQEPNRR